MAKECISRQFVLELILKVNWNATYSNQRKQANFISSLAQLVQFLLHLPPHEYVWNCGPTSKVSIVDLYIHIYIAQQKA